MYECDIKINIKIYHFDYNLLIYIDKFQKNR